MEWIFRLYANRWLLGVDKFMRIERLGLAGLGLPASGGGLWLTVPLFAKLLGRTDSYLLL
jgi:hypothetical protein